MSVSSSSNACLAILVLIAIAIAIAYNDLVKRMDEMNRRHNQIVNDMQSSPQPNHDVEITEQLNNIEDLVCSLKDMIESKTSESKEIATNDDEDPSTGEHLGPDQEKD